MKQCRLLVVLPYLFLSAVLQAADPALPQGTPDYAGTTISNFMAKAATLSDVQKQEYTLPTIDSRKALIVDPAGIGGKPSDKNPGTIAQPFASLSRATQNIKPGTVVLLRAGEHKVGKGIKLDGSRGQKGTPDQPIVIASYPGEVAVITACEELTGWKQTGNEKVWQTNLSRPANPKDAMWVNGKLITSARRMAGRKRTGNYPKKGNAPLEGGPAVAEPGTFAMDSEHAYLRAPGDADPNTLTVTRSSLNMETAGSIECHNSGWIIFYRLHFRQNQCAVYSLRSPYVILRECIFENGINGLILFGGNSAERDIIDRCMFNRIGDASMGSPIYNTAPITIRHSLFRNNYPNLAITAYTSKDDGFTGLHVIGNTFIHSGSTITSTAKDAIIRGNVALCSRFLSSTGSNAVVENNIAVYDPLDLEVYPKVPRRNVGFRAYGRNMTMNNNTLVGFSYGGRIYGAKHQNEAAAGTVAVFRFGGNRIYKYAKYGVRVYAPDKFVSLNNIYAPAAKENDKVIYLTPSQDNKRLITLSEAKALGLDEGGKVAPGEEPALPRVILEAMAKR